MEVLSQRTLSAGKDYRNSSKDYKLPSPALYFLNQIGSPLASLSLVPPLLFLSKMDGLPRGIITNKGLNKKTLLSPPPTHPLLPLVTLSPHPSFRAVLFMESFSRSLKDFHLLSCPPLPPSCRPERSAICNGICAGGA